MLHKISIFILIIMICIISALSVHAEDRQYMFEDIVIVASRIDSPLQEAPANVTVIKRKDIEESGAQSITDVLSRETGLFSLNYIGNPQSAKIDIHGYGEAAPQNILFLIDGRRINNIDISGADLSQIPIDAIERIEVYRGPASVLYGDNAAGGVVNIILKKGEGKPKITVGTAFGSHNYMKNHLSLSSKEKTFSYYLMSSYSDTAGYRQNNNFIGRDIFGNVNMDVSKQLSFTVKFGFHRDDYGLPGSLIRRRDLISGIYGRNDSNTPDDSASTEDNFVDLEGRIKVIDDVLLSIGASYRNKHIAYHYEGTGWFFDQKSHLDTVSFTPKLTVSMPVFKRANTLVAGVDYYRYPYVADSYGGVWTANISNIWKTDLGYYINDKFHITPDLFLETGYRYQRARYEFDYVDAVATANSYKGRRTDSKEAARVSAGYLLKDKGNIYASYSKGFRFPAVEEFIGTDPTTWAQFFNPDIAPQTVEEISTGIRLNPTKRIGGELSLYHAATWNEIYYNPKYANSWGTWLGRNENYDKTKRQGLDAKLMLGITEKLNLDLFYSYIEAKFDGGLFDGNWIPFVPKNKFGIIATFCFRLDNQDFTVKTSATGYDRRYAISDQENLQTGVPGYVLFDASILYKLKERLNVVFAIKNLMNTEYYEAAVYGPNRNDIGMYPAPKRQFLFGLQYQFGG